MGPAEIAINIMLDVIVSGFYQSISRQIPFQNSQYGQIFLAITFYARIGLLRRVGRQCNSSRPLRKVERDELGPLPVCLSPSLFVTQAALVILLERGDDLPHGGKITEGAKK